MPEPRLVWVRLDDADLPAAVAEVLAPEAAEGRPAPVRAFDRRVADDLAAAVEEPVAELVVLVADELLVERVAAPRGEAGNAHEDGVDLRRLGQVVVAGPADANGVLVATAIVAPPRPRRLPGRARRPCRRRCAAGR